MNTKDDKAAMEKTSRDIDQIWIMVGSIEIWAKCTFWATCFIGWILFMMLAFK